MIASYSGVEVHFEKMASFCDGTNRIYQWLTSKARYKCPIINVREKDKHFLRASSTVMKIIIRWFFREFSQSKVQNNSVLFCFLIMD